MSDVIIAHYDEIALKGRNRGFFEAKLAENIRQHLAEAGRFRVRRQQGKIEIESEAALAPDRRLAVEAALKRVFGLGYFIFARRSERGLAAMGRTALELLGEHGAKTFKVETRRSDKTFPYLSPEVSREVGGIILAARPDLTVDVHEPETAVHIEIGRAEAFVSLGHIQGAGGLPTGVSGSVVALLSGGIDSPVAAWKLMRRGSRVIFAHFHSAPYVGRESLDKVRRLAGVLAGYQGEAKVYMVPIGDAQREIVAKADARLRVILYRRLMLRCADAIAQREKALGLVTGESLGQVASQTLENMAAVSAATRLPIYRPLIGEDKNAIVEAARAIGTLAISNEPHDDCCSLFIPANPATKSRPERAEAEEMQYDVKALAAAALAGAEIIDLCRSTSLQPR